MTEYEKNDFKICCLKEKIKFNEKIVEKYINIPEYTNLIIEPFKPSKTAKNSLSLFSIDEENNLINKEQSKEIVNFFRFLTFLFNKNTKEQEEIIENNLIEFFFHKFVPENMSLSN